MKMLLAVFLIACSIFYHTNVEANEECRLIGQMAKAVMTLRQKNLPISEVLETSENLGDESVYRTAKKITLEAYKRPLMSSVKYRNRIIQEFSNDWVVQCLVVTEGSYD